MTAVNIEISFIDHFQYWQHGVTRYLKKWSEIAIQYDFTLCIVSRPSLLRHLRRDRLSHQHLHLVLLLRCSADLKLDPIVPTLWYCYRLLLPGWPLLVDRAVAATIITTYVPMPKYDVVFMCTVTRLK